MPLHVMANFGGFLCECGLESLINLLKASLVYGHIVRGDRCLKDYGFRLSQARVDSAEDLGPPLGLHINIAKCELYSPCDLRLFPSDMKRFTSPHFEILGAPIGDIIFCGKFVAQKRAEARHLLTQLEEVGSVDPQVALLLLRLCGSFCRLVHLARSTPPSLIVDGLALFDNDVRHCFAECTMVDTSDAAWQQAQLSLSRGGLGLRRHSLHSPAAYIASVVASDCSSPQSKHLLHAIDLFNASVPNTDELTITSITTSNLTQKLLSAKLENQQFTKLFANASLPDRARLLSISSPHSSAWLSVTPSPRLNLHLDPSEFQVAIKWWLGLPVSQEGHWIDVTLEGVALDSDAFSPQRGHWIHVTLEGVALDSCSEGKQFEALASTTRNSPVVALQWIAEQLVQRVEEPAVESFLDSCRV
eukprot:Em0031g29a